MVTSRIRNKINHLPDLQVTKLLEVTDCTLEGYSSRISGGTRGRGEGGGHRNNQVITDSEETHSAQTQKNTLSGYFVTLYPVTP